MSFRSKEGKNTQAGTIGSGGFPLVCNVRGWESWRFRPRQEPDFCLRVYSHQPTSRLFLEKLPAMTQWPVHQSVNGRTLCFEKAWKNIPLTFTHAKCVFVKETFSSRDMLFTTLFPSQVQKVGSSH